jgi:excisionase family DNA binding protein
MALEKLYSVKEAAEALRVSTWTIWGKLRRGEIRRTKIGKDNGRTVIRESELQRLIRDAK